MGPAVYVLTADRLQRDDRGSCRNHSNQENEKSMKAVRVIGIVCIAAGMLFFLTPQIREVRMNQELKNLQQTDTMKGLSDVLAGDTAGEQGETGEKTGNTSHAAAESCEEVRETRDELYEQMKSFNRTLFEEGQEIAGPEDYEKNPIGEEGAIGSVRIPDMDVELPLYLGATYEHLDKGAAVLGCTSMPVGGINSNCVISGHRSWCGAPYFRDIDLLKEGSAVMVNNGRETLYYRVFEKQIILPDNTEAVRIRPGKDMVTLITCHPYLGGGTHRYVVYCERCEEKDSENTAEAEDTIENTRESIQFPESKEEPETEREKGEKSMGKTAKLIRMERFIRCVVAAMIIAASAAVLFKRGRKHRRK